MRNEEMRRSFVTAIVVAAVVAAAVSVTVGQDKSAEGRRPGAGKETPRDPYAALTPAERHAVAKFFTLKMEQAERLTKARLFEQAERLIAALWAMDAARFGLKERLRALADRCADAKTKNRTVDAYLRVPKLVVPAGGTAVVSLVVANRSDETVVLLRPEGMRDTPVRTAWITVRRRCVNGSGDVGVKEWHNVAVLRKGEVTLRCGQAWVKELKFETPEADEDDLVAYRYTVSGGVSVQALCGEQRIARTVALTPVRFVVVPAAAVGFAERPFFVLADALKEAAKGVDDARRLAELRRKVFYSALLLPEESKYEAIAALMCALPHVGRDMKAVVFATLKLLTDLSYVSEAEWLKWWNRLRVER